MGLTQAEKEFWVTLPENRGRLSISEYRNQYLKSPFARHFCRCLCSAVLGKHLAGCSSEENQVADRDEETVKKKNGSRAWPKLCTAGSVGRSQKLLKTTGLLK